MPRPFTPPEPGAPILEICVDSPAGLAAAVSGGADRIELCSALALGGLTPGPGLIALAARAGVPCHAMIRPAPGDFVLRSGDLAAMCADIAAVRSAGLAGVVIGVARPDGTLDAGALARLREAAHGLEVTLHRVFDLAPDPLVAVDTAIDLGLTRILTSGQAPAAPDGTALLKTLVQHAAGRIQIMAGGGVGLAAVRPLLATGIDALHASASRPDPSQADCTRIGIAAPRIADPAVVADLRAAMRHAATRTSGGNSSAKSPKIEVCCI